MSDGRERGAVRSTRRVGLIVAVLSAIGVGVAGVGRSSVPSHPPVPAAASPTTVPEVKPVEPTAPSTTRATAPAKTPRPPASRPSRPESRAPTAAEEPVDGNPAPPQLSAARLQAAFDKWLAGQSGARSVAVGVAYTGDGSRLWTGEAHVGEPLFHADDEYGVLSITKTFTEALVLREVAAGRIDLDAPMPPITGLEVDTDDPVVTPRMLLQHTSGLVNYSKAVGYDPSRPITPREIVSLSLHSPLLSPPGRQANYSNTNFHWLGLLLEQVTGQSYDELVARLAADLGLTHTRLDPTGRPGWIGYASGGLRSTLGDLTRWGAALFTPGRVLRAEELAPLTTVGDAGVSLGLWPLCPCDGARHPAGLRQTVNHGGFYFFPGRDVVVVVHYEPAGTVSADVVDALAGALSS